MIAEKVKKEKVEIFEPYVLKITIESRQEEIDIRNVFNHAYIVDVVKSGKQFSKIKELLPDNNDFNKFATNLKGIFKERS